MAGTSTLAGSRAPGPQEVSGDTAATPASGHFRPDIEGLRAVAVGLVLAQHVFGWPAGGFVGVDVFFVISGFLITSLLVRERSRTGRISFRGFYARRARRLLPAALVTLGATTAAAYYLFLEGRFQETVTDVVWAALFGANINFASQGNSYLEAQAAPSMVRHFWSLSVEEQFYVVWPALILLAFAVSSRRARPGGRHRAVAPVSDRRRTIALFVLLGAVTAASFAWSVHATSTSPVTAYFSTFTRAWELGAGALVAVAATQLQRVPAVLRAIFAWAGLALVFASATVLIDERTAFPGSAAALPVLGAVLLVAWGGAPGGPAARWALGSAPAGFLGAISYSLYLWHWPVLIVAGALLGSNSLLVQIGIVGVSLVLASISYYCIEQPVLHTNWLLPHRAVDAARARSVFVRARAVGLSAVLATAVAVGALVFVPWGDGGDARAEAARAVTGTSEAAVADAAPLTPLQRDIREATYATEWPDDLDPTLDEMPKYGADQWVVDCLAVGGDNVDDCRFGPPDAARSAVLLGDSYATQWLPTLQHELVPAGWSVQSLTLGQCPNITALTWLYDEEYTTCVEHRNWAIERILEQRPTLVVLSNAWTADVIGASSADRPAVYGQGLTDIVRRLQPSGAHIVIMGALPGSENLQKCPTSINGPDDCLSGPVETFAAQMETERQVAAATGVVAVDPQEWFCIEGLCPTFVGTTPVYFDGRHMTVEYAERIAPLAVASFGLP